MIFMLPRTLASRPPAWTNDSQTCRSLDSTEWSYTERTNVKVFVMTQLTISILIDFSEFVGRNRPESEHRLSAADFLNLDASDTAKPPSTTWPRHCLCRLHTQTHRLHSSLPSSKSSYRSTQS